MISATSPKSIAKQYIEKNIDKPLSNSRLYKAVERRLRALDKISAPGSICRRIRDAKAELKLKYKFVSVDKDSAESWFKIIKREK